MACCFDRTLLGSGDFRGLLHLAGLDALYDVRALTVLCFGFLVIFSCSQPTPPVQAHASFCDVARPIIWSAQDTRKTKEQADAHNRVGKELCGWGAKR